MKRHGKYTHETTFLENFFLLVPYTLHVSDKCRMPLLRRWVYLISNEKDKRRQTAEPQTKRRFHGIHLLVGG